MILEAKVSFVRKVNGGNQFVRSEYLQELIKWSNEDSYVKVDTMYVSTEIIKELSDLHKESDEKKSEQFVRKAKSFLAVADSTTSDLKISKLEQIPDALRSIVEKQKNKWLFISNDGEKVLPWFLEFVSFHPTKLVHRTMVPAHVDITLSCNIRGKKKSIKFHFEKDVVGKKLSDVFRDEGIYFETDEILDDYNTDMEFYKTIHLMTGTQMSASGNGYIDNKSWWDTAKRISMVVDGIPSTVLIDDFDDEHGDGSKQSKSSTHDITADSSFWTSKQVSESMIDDEDSPDRIFLPLHPYINVFDLNKHKYVEIHTCNLSEFQWNEKLIDKLIIDDGDLNLIKLLVSTSNQKKEDIISGKMPGIFVLSTGKPGTGKTLTAEIFSHYTKRPLYSVACSQLGLSPDDIEEKLKIIMRNAQRWGAILLIDEADVYIRERGLDINQNAIVGVFLRIIEYYRGIIFMTSNIQEIDDAIASRATAWIKYNSPNEDMLEKICRIMADQYGVKISDSDISKLVSQFEGASGRTIRNLFKLCSSVNSNPTVETIIEMSKYQKIN